MVVKRAVLAAVLTVGVVLSGVVSAPANAAPKEPKKSCYEVDGKRYCCPQGTVGVKVKGEDVPKCAHRPKKP